MKVWKFSLLALFGNSRTRKSLFQWSMLVLLLLGSWQGLAAQTACSYVISGPGSGTSIDVGGTSVGLGDDQVTGALPIGFNFNFFGVTYSSFVISSNGFISFDPSVGSGCCSGQLLPNNTNPWNLVAGYWEDLNPTLGGSIGYGVFGSAPARRLVVSYTSVPHHPGGIPVTFQIKLHETSNVAEVVCIDCSSDGGLHTQGIENANGSVAFVPSGRNNVSFGSANETTTFTPIDVTAPTATCPGNISIACSAPVSYSVSGSDNCSFARVTLVGGLASGATFPTGTTTVTFRARDHGTAGVFNNGAGGTFSYNEGDSPQTIALKACESVYGVSNCVIGACGSFTYYYRSGHLQCNCGKTEGQYEFIYSNAGYTDVGQDYGGTNAPVSFVPFVRVKGPNGCSVPNTWLLSNDRLGGNFTDCSFNVTAGTGVTPSNAGPDQNLCGTAANLAGNTPSVGTGSWSIVAGAGGTVTTPASPTSGFTGVAGTTYTLRWSIAQAPCATSTDDVIITLRANPTASGAGADQSICGTSATLAGNTPSVGTGAWSIVSGAGGSIVTPTSPNSTFTGVQGTTYTLRWTIANAPCTASTDDVLITFTANPSAANAGPDQNLCGTSATLGGNTPGTGSGSWSIVTGAGGTVTTPGSPTSNFTGVQGTTYTLRWTIANAPCVASTDDVLITLRANPTASNAGTDQNICGTSTSLGSNTPAVGTGAWTIISGAGGSIVTPSSPTSTFTGLQGTTYTLRWTISNAPCTASTDDVLVTFVNNPSAANAGPDQTICGTSTTLAGNSPGAGSGLWSVVTGAGGSFVTPSSPTTTFNGVAGNVYTLRWTIINAPCAATTDDVVITTDIVAPSITCPANIAVANDPTLCSAVATYTAPVGTDNCPSPTTARTAGLASGSAFPVGATINTFRVTDAAGTTSSCSFTVTVTDGELPAISCPANLTVNASPGVCTGTATYSAPVGTDNCPSAVTVRTGGVASGGTFPSGSTTNIFRVTDAAGNSATCSFIVTVIDNQMPSITCPANVTVGNTTTLCTGVATYTAPTGADNCSATTAQTLGLASGATYPVGPTTNTFTATDAAGNSSSCSFIVTVADVESPAITCPPSFSLNTDFGQCTAVLPYPVPTGTDNCTGASTSQTAGLPSGVAFPIGPTTCTFQVTDAAGNTSTCAFTATVVDNQAPLLTCPLNFSVGTSTNSCDATTTYPSPTGSDNCAGGSLTLISGIASGGVFPLGSTTNTFMATDGGGNTATCSFVLTVTDNVLPTINCPAAITANAAPGTCATTVSFTTPLGTDNCSGASTIQIQGFTPGSSFPVGITSNKFQVTDAAGNTSSCTMTVTVVDNQAPTITCPANMTMNTDPGACTSSPTFATPTGTDNCTGATTTQIAGLVSGSALALGVNTNTFRVTDAGGNSATCSFTITVNDNQVPSITCPANMTVNTGIGLCGATVNYTAPIGTDNCSATTTQTVGSASGSNFSVGLTTNTFRATDGNGNSSTCSFNITVVDNLPPTWSACPANISVSTSPTTCNAVVTWTAPTVSDNCGVLGSSGSPASGSTFALGTTTVTYTAADAGGNTGTCAFTVTVSDNVAPTAACHNAVVILDSLGNGTLTAAGVDNGSTDNCGPVTLALSQGTFTCNNAGTSTITLIVTDANGNTSTCNASVNVVAPAVSGSATVAVANCGFNVSCNGGSDGVATAAGSGGCPSYTYLWSNGSTNATASGLPAGIATVTITDGAGGTHVATVTLTEPTAVTSATVPSSSCLGDSTGAIDLSVAGGNDCLPYTYLWSNGATTEDLSNVPAGTYMVTITDGGGCTHVDSATVTAFAALNPTITNAGNVLTSGQAWTSYQWLQNGSNINGATTNTYTAMTTGSYSLLVTDANGCTAVTDTINLTIVGIADQAGDWMSLSIFPNPARNEFRLRTDAPIGYALSVHIYDMYGKQYVHQVLPDLGREVAFDIKSFSAGTYFVEVTSDAGQRKLFRLVVQ